MLALLGGVGITLGIKGYRALTPTDQTPEGAYSRLAENVSREKYIMVFPYLETEAQWAAFSIRNARREAFALIEKHFPADERERLRPAYEELAKAEDGSNVFVMYAERKGWFRRLRKDLSGISFVEKDGELATIQTAKGTRYTFRRRKENGIWGLTLFTAELVAERDRAARDLSAIQKAATDYAADHAAAKH